MFSENLDIDEMFLEEIKLHNYLIETSCKLQTVFSELTGSALVCSDSIGVLIDLIQKKEFDQARYVVTNVVYSLSTLCDTLVSLIDKLNSGALSGKETYGN